MPTAEAKALGLMGPNANFDGTVTFGAAFQFTYDPNNRAVFGEYDIIGLAEHEITEAMGRTFGLGRTLGSIPRSYLPYRFVPFFSVGHAKRDQWQRHLFLVGQWRNDS